MDANLGNLRRQFFLFRRSLSECWSNFEKSLHENDWDNAPYIEDQFINEKWLSCFVVPLGFNASEFQPLPCYVPEIRQPGFRYSLRTLKPFSGNVVSIGAGLENNRAGPPFDHISVWTDNGDVKVVPVAEVTLHIHPQQIQFVSTMSE